MKHALQSLEAEHDQQQQQQQLLQAALPGELQGRGSSQGERRMPDLPTDGQGDKRYVLTVRRRGSPAEIGECPKWTIPAKSDADESAQLSLDP